MFQTRTTFLTVCNKLQKIQVTSFLAKAVQLKRCEQCLSFYLHLLVVSIKKTCFSFLFMFMFKLFSRNLCFHITKTNMRNPFTFFFFYVSTRYISKRCPLLVCRHITITSNWQPCLIYFFYILLCLSRTFLNTPHYNSKVFMIAFKWSLFFRIIVVCLHVCPCSNLCRYSWIVT